MNRYQAIGATREQADAELDDNDKDRAIKFYEGFWFEARRLSDTQLVRALSDICDYAWHDVVPAYSDDDAEVERVFDRYRTQARRDWKQIGKGRAKAELAALRKASKRSGGGQVSVEETKSLSTKETRSGHGGEAGASRRPDLGYGNSDVSDLFERDDG